MKLQCIFETVFFEMCHKIVFSLVRFGHSKAVLEQNTKPLCFKIHVGTVPALQSSSETHIWSNFTNVKNSVFAADFRGRPLTRPPTGFDRLNFSEQGWNF